MTLIVASFPSHGRVAMKNAAGAARVLEAAANSPRLG
jgi:hypothetical protein